MNSIPSSSLRRIKHLLHQLNPHESKPTIQRAFRTLHTGIERDPDAATFERRRPLKLDLRKKSFEQDKSRVYPHTTILLIDHVFHVAKLLEAKNIHLKYVEDSGDTYIMFRTK